MAIHHAYHKHISPKLVTIKEIWFPYTTLSRFVTGFMDCQKGNSASFPWIHPRVMGIGNPLPYTVYGNR